MCVTLFAVMNSKSYTNGERTAARRKLKIRQSAMDIARKKGRKGGRGKWLTYLSGKLISNEEPIFDLDSTHELVFHHVGTEEIFRLGNANSTSQQFLCPLLNRSFFLV